MADETVVEQVPLEADEKEADLIRLSFKENEALLVSIRNLLFAIPISEGEKQLIHTTFASTEMREMMRKRFLPTMADSKTIGFVTDLWLNGDKMVFGQSKETVKQAIDSKNMAIKMLTKGLALLADPDGEKVFVDYMPHLDDELGTTLLGRNVYVQAVCKQLQMLWLIAQSERKTAAELEKDKKKDSSK